MTHAFQIVFLLPLLLLPFACSRGLYEKGVRYTKGCFVSLLREYDHNFLCPHLSLAFSVLVTQWFAPTRMSITFEREGLGRFTEQEIEQVVVRNMDGEVVALNLPSKSILVANHQVRFPTQSHR